MRLDQIQTEYLTKKNLLEKLDQYDVYAYYIGAFDVYNVMSSPFRKDDNPSFGVFYRNGDLIYNDYKLGGGDCIAFVSYMENCSYYQAMGILNKRYNLGYLEAARHKFASVYTKKPVKYNKSIVEKPEYWIDVSFRPWQQHDKEYWQQYEISLATLQYYDVNPINRFWVNGFSYHVDKHAYSYFYSDRVFKIYQPFKPVSEGKFYSNIKDKEQYQGVNQLPDSGELLFITSSLKDVMVLYEAGFWAIAPHTEHQILSEGLFSHYSQNWGIMNVLYDNDEAGMKHADKMVQKYGLKSLVLPDSDTKDPSDFVKKYDLETLKLWLNERS